jgi:hypothetical protein
VLSLLPEQPTLGRASRSLSLSLCASVPLWHLGLLRPLPQHLLPATLSLSFYAPPCLFQAHACGESTRDTQVHATPGTRWEERHTYNLYLNPAPKLYTYTPARVFERHACRVSRQETSRGAPVQGQ